MLCVENGWMLRDSWQTWVSDQMDVLLNALTTTKAIARLIVGGPRVRSKNETRDRIDWSNLMAKK